MFGICLESNKFPNVYFRNNENSEHNRVLLLHSIVWHMFGDKHIPESLHSEQSKQWVQLSFVTSRHCLASFWWQTHFWMSTLWIIIIKTVSTIEFCYITSLFGIFLEKNKFLNVYIMNDQNSDHNWVLLHHSIVWNLFRDKQITECLHYEWSKQWALSSFVTSQHCLESFWRQTNFWVSTLWIIETASTI